MNLTADHRLLLLHRFEDSDFALSLADDPRLDMTMDQAEAAVDRLQTIVQGGILSGDRLDPFTRDAFVECVEGSTYFFSVNPEDLEGRRFDAALDQAARELEVASSHLAGRRVKFPR